MIQYGHQYIDQDDVDAVVAVMKGDWLTQGPKIEEFEKALAEYCGASYAVAVTNGTAALHAAYAAVGLSSGDEIITSPMTFAATANAALWQGAHPVFVDIDTKTGNIDPSLIEGKITEKTKVIVPIDYTGRPAELGIIREIARAHNIVVVEDACQALGALYNGNLIGSISDLTAFSFHPVKSITTGEGGAVLTDNEDWYKTMKKFVTHGMIKSEQQMLGQNYRLTDIQCALGISQMKKLDRFIDKRRVIAKRYHEALSDIPYVSLPPADTELIQSAWHLYVIRFATPLVKKKAEIAARLRDNGVGTQVHHIPVYFHPYYNLLGYQIGLCPNAETWYDAALSIPIHPNLTDAEQEMVIGAIKKTVDFFL